MKPHRKRYVLRGAFVTERLDEAHRTHAAFAAEFDLSRSYWSQVVNGHRDLSPDVRRAILDHPLFAGVPESDVWDVHPPRNEQFALPGTDVALRGAA